MQASERQISTHAPMTQYPVIHGELVIGGIPLSRLAARVGQTPFYAYKRQLLAQRVAQLGTVAGLDQAALRDEGQLSPCKQRRT